MPPQGVNRVRQRQSATTRQRRDSLVMRDARTATLTATRSTFSSSTKIIMHDHPPDRDHRVPSRTLWMDLRIRRLGVRIPPGAPVSSLVKTFFSRSAKVRCRWALGAIAGAIGRQQRLGHPNSSCALLALEEMAVLRAGGDYC